MDPLSVTSVVVSLTAKCMQTAKQLNDLRDKYRSAQIIISAICSESTVISVSLSQLQALMLQNPQILSTRLAARPEIQSTFDTVLTGCMVVFTILEEEILKLKRGDDSFQTFGFRAKARYVWNEEMMQNLLGEIRGLQSTMSLLLQLLQM